MIVLENHVRYAWPFSVWLFLSLSVSLSLSLSLFLSLSLCFCESVCLYLSLSVSLSMSVCLSVSPPPLPPSLLLAKKPNTRGLSQWCVPCADPACQGARRGRQEIGRAEGTGGSQEEGWRGQLSVDDDCDIDDDDTAISNDVILIQWWWWWQYLAVNRLVNRFRKIWNCPLQRNYH